jgi:hypothetical protein
VIRTLLELIIRNLRGWIIQSLRTFRRPAYLTGVVAMVALFMVIFAIARPGIPAHIDTNPLEITAPLQQITHTGVALMLALIVSCIWLIPRRSPVLKLTETETVFLLPAPLPYRRVIQYTLSKSQPGILFSSLVFALFRSGAFIPDQPGRFIHSYVYLWTYLTLFELHFKGSGLWKLMRRKQSESGKHTSAAFRFLLPLLIILCFWTVILNGLGEILDAVRSDIGAFQGTKWNEQIIADILMNLDLSSIQDGVVSLLLSPFLLISKPMVFPEGGYGWLSAFVLIGLLILHIEWIIRSQKQYREMGVKAHRNPANSDTPFYKFWGIFKHSLNSRPFQLKPAGLPEIAIIWKSCVQVTRIPVIHILWMTLGAFITMTVITLHFGLPRVLSGVLGFAGIFLTFNACFLNLGNDIHNDFRNFEMVKVWPISGFRMMAAKVFASALMTTFVGAVGMGCLLIAALNMFTLNPSDMYLALALLPVYTGVAAVFSSLHCFSPLLFPQLHLAKKEKEGLANTGQRLIMILAMLLILAFGLIPVGVIVGIIPIIQIMRGMTIPLWEYPILGFASLPLFLLEAGILVSILGHLWDQLDPSRELLDP